MAPLPADLRWAALRELASLRVHAQRTGCDLEALIGVPPRIRAQLEAFVAAEPVAGRPVREALDQRDYMLRVLKEDQ
jgi:hypothetical protein